MISSDPNHHIMCRQNTSPSQVEHGARTQAEAAIFKTFFDPTCAG